MLKINKKIIAFITLLTTAGSLTFAQDKVSWNGYLQYRFADNYLNQSDFSVRRAKFWIKGVLPVNEGKWGYKVQANFLQKSEYRFELQDVLVNYKINNLKITAGQFVPNFSLQRKQPDYVIPLNERADVVNALVPGAETMARDIGFELSLKDNKTGSLSMGFFNGNGANNVSDRKNFLYISRGSLYLIDHSETQLEFGLSLSYRNAHELQFSKIFGKNISFTGNDIRFGFEGKLNIGGFELQSEYLEAHPGSQKATGFYALADYLFSSKNLITFSIERLNDLNDLTVDSPWYSIGYSYLLKDQEIKFTLENKLQFVSEKTNSLTTLQFQYFFNQK